MATFPDPQQIPRKKPGLQLKQTTDGRTLLFDGQQVRRIEGLAPELIRQVWDLIDGRNRIADICDQLENELDRPVLLDFFSALEDVLLPPELTSGPSAFSKTNTKDGDHASVGILGGGTAGYLTALALRRQLPHLNVTLIESSRIPIIGVGEATTPLIVPFLHEVLGLDREEFYRAVRPTWKLGIKFFWGRPGSYYFNNAFGFGDLLPAWHFSGDINQASLVSLLMSANRGLLLQHPDHPAPYEILTGRLDHAYHLENNAFVTYLQQKALAAGVRHFDREVVSAGRDPVSGDVDYLLTRDGEKLTFDLYVDCSGFRSLLMRQTIGSPFVDFRPSLFTDTAIVANIPQDGRINPFTLAESMHHGWNWNTPLRGENHRGYVFSADFCTEEEAVEEMKRTNPGMTDHRVVTFRSGRCAHFWKGNVVAIGNAYGFVEPLESTGIHMIIEAIQALVRHLPRKKDDTRVVDQLNRKMNRQWDYLRWFLAVHYRFNQKYDTPFWRACRQETDISGLEDLIRLYREQGLLSVLQVEHPEWFTHLTDTVFGAYGLDILLLGQGVLPGGATPPAAEKKRWLDQLAAWQQVVDRALPQANALPILDKRPELLATPGLKP